MTCGSVQFSNATGEQIEIVVGYLALLVDCLALLVDGPTQGI
jgi:hypothetical protein